MHRLIDKLARLFALLGGVTLCALIVLVCVSVLGRSLNGILHSDLLQNLVPGVADAFLALGIGPLNGDFEIVEAGMAFAIFAFLPICQLRGAHASVDVFTSNLPDGVTQTLRLISEVVFAAALVLLAWYLALGGISKFRSGQTTFLLEFPVWWSYAASTFALAVAALVAVYVAVSRLIEVATGQPGPLIGDGADH
ncbi:MAG: TRAP transporter small permease [Marinovum sp.]|nr:TRAP transporter small permease [Marinovum sp.]